ncbi:MAG: hypothetical protein M1522_04660, partial [Actinobacteria bacterium]|nr:hypothetical protein [Actinomycetota bacterium]
VGFATQVVHPGLPRTRLEPIAWLVAPSQARFPSGLPAIQEIRVDRALAASTLSWQEQHPGTSRRMQGPVG